MRSDFDQPGRTALEGGLTTFSLSSSKYSLHNSQSHCRGHSEREYAIVKKKAQTDKSASQFRDEPASIQRASFVLPAIRSLPPPAGPLSHHEKSKMTSKSRYEGHHHHHHHHHQPQWQQRREALCRWTAVSTAILNEYRHRLWALSKIATRSPINLHSDNDRTRNSHYNCTIRRPASTFPNRQNNYRQAYDTAERYNTFETDTVTCRLMQRRYFSVLQTKCRRIRTCARNVESYRYKRGDLLTNYWQGWVRLWDEGYKIFCGNVVEEEVFGTDRALRDGE